MTIKATPEAVPHRFDPGDLGPWSLRNGWTYKAFDRQIGSREFGPFSGAKELWDRKCGIATLPKWTDFDGGEVREWLGRISVEDIIPGETFNSRFRLWGTLLHDL